MKCEAPYQRATKWREWEEEFPCGRCLACRINRAEAWSERLLLELEDRTKMGDFLTLTIEDGHCPLLPLALSKRLLQNFFKRIRKDHKIKYFACGEYGEKHHRAHYHAIIIRETTPIDYDQYWTIGRGKNQKQIGTTLTKGVGHASARYVTGYLTKSNAVPHSKRKWPPFQLQSQGLGKDYITENADFEKLRKEIKWIPSAYRKLIKNLPPMQKRWRLAEITAPHLQHISTQTQIMHRRSKNATMQEHRTSRQNG